jgi:hypothetical protein
MLSALVLTPSPAAPDPAHAIHVTGYEPQHSGVLGDEQPAHFTIEEIPCIPSRSCCSPEPGNLAKRIACYHLCPARTLPGLIGPLPSLYACSDTVRPCHALWTLVQSDFRPTLNMRPAGQSVCAPCHLRRLAARRATPHAPRQRDPRAFQAAPQPPRHPAVATLPRSLATHRHRCRINCSLAPSPPQLGVVGRQPDRPHSSTLCPICPPHPRHVGQPVEALCSPPRKGQLPDLAPRHGGALVPVRRLPHCHGRDTGAVATGAHSTHTGCQRPGRAVSAGCAHPQRPDDARVPEAAQCVPQARGEGHWQHPCPPLPLAAVVCQGQGLERQGI